MSLTRRHSIFGRVTSLINQVLGRPVKPELVPVRVPVRRESLPYVRRDRW